MTYRLLDTMRAYALRKLAEGGDLDRAARRHAEHFRALFARAAADWETEPTGQWLDAWQGQIGNLRAALDWAFGPSGDAGDRRRPHRRGGAALVPALADRGVPGAGGDGARRRRPSSSIPAG